jgi:hypothetical protein
MADLTPEQRAECERVMEALVASMFETGEARLEPEPELGPLAVRLVVNIPPESE